MKKNLSAVLAWLLDLALAGVVAWVAVILYYEAVANASGIVTPAGLAVVIIHGGVLFFRRRFPLPTLAVMLATAAIYTLAMGFPVVFLGPAILIGVYTVASLLERRVSIWALAVTEVLAGTLGVAGTPGWPGMLQFLAMIAIAWFLGDLTRRWRTAAELHQARAAELAAAREELARQAVTEERLRIARELHDVVAHSMTVISLHAGSGRLHAADNPAAAAEALETIERASREALSDMRRLVGMLRQGEEASTEPVPGLDQVDRLLTEVRAAGIEVDFDRSGPLAEVPAGLSLAAYRVIQEALTNLVRHSGAAKARLRVALDIGRLEVEIVNGPSVRSVTAVAGSGHGLAGMAERAALYGGSIEHGPTVEGGYRLLASFPSKEQP